MTVGLTAARGKVCSELPAHTACLSLSAQLCEPWLSFVLKNIHLDAQAAPMWLILQ